MMIGNLDGLNTLGMTRRLYEDMPGAPQPSVGDRGTIMWSEVEGTPMYKFCERITAEIMGAAYAAFHDARNTANHTDR
jgi:hypothetical protein